ncbi:MAG: tyrosine/phenylalanine carboxypeptidase domain-containing protein [Candidatus Absconditabacteria bacterium]
MNLNINNHKNNFTEQIQNDIFTPVLQEIIGMTYVYVCNKEISEIKSYEDLLQSKFINKTIFIDFAGGTLQDDPYFLYELANKKLQEKLTEINNYITILENKNEPSYLILLNSLKSASNILEIAILGLPFELEKMGTKTKQSMEQAKINVDKIQNLEQAIYGGNVLENQAELSMSYEYLSGLFIQSYSLLTDHQKKLFLDWLQLIKSQIFFTNGKNNHIQNLNHKLDENWKKMINIEDAKNIFQLVIQIYGLNKTVIIDDSGNFRVTEKGLHIPNRLSQISLISILKLIVHEIETHMICNHNNNITLGTFKGANHSEKEESLAVISEEVLIGSDLNILKYSGMIPVILMGELLEGREFWDFMSIYTLLRKEKLNPLSFLRFKRNYSFKHKGVQHKDTSYYRGISQIFDYLKSGKDPKDLYIGNISLADTKEIADKINGKNKQLKFPLMISEIIVYSMNHHKINHSDFLHYLEEKYSFTNINLNADNLKLSQKKKLIHILNIIGETYYS